MSSRQQQVEQHSQRVHIGGRRDGPACYLLGRRKLWGQGASAFDRQQRRRRRFRIVAEELSNAKVQQLYAAVVSDEHVRRLDVAVDDQISYEPGATALST